MQQQTFAEVPFEQYRKSTQRDWFLDEMARVIPWEDLAGVIARFYPKARGLGVRRWAWTGCSAFIFCNIGSICLTRRRGSTL